MPFLAELVSENAQTPFASERARTPRMKPVKIIMSEYERMVNVGQRLVHLNRRDVVAVR